MCGGDLPVKNSFVSLGNAKGESIFILARSAAGFRPRLCIAGLQHSIAEIASSE
jgi:hypothetical protein